MADFSPLYGGGIKNYARVNRYIGIAHHMKPIDSEELGMTFIVFEIVEHNVKTNGGKFIEPEVEVNTWWTSLNEEPEIVIRLYYNHV